MANAFTTEERILFEDVIEGFDPNNITARQVSNYSPPMRDYERAGNTFHRPVPMIAVTTTGRDMSSNFKDHTELTVPVTLAEATDIHNVGKQYSAVELNDPLRRSRLAVAARQALSAKVDNIIGTTIAQQGSVVLTKSTALSTYSDVAQCEEALSIRDAAIDGEKTMILNPGDYNGLAAVLAGKETLTGKPLTAYERSQIPSVGSFDTFKANFTKTIAAAGGSSITVDGANQRHVPAAMSSGSLVDNRYQNITLSATTGMAVGDAFTIAGVNSVGLIHKEDTGVLQTFRVVEIVSGTVAKISPAIISADSSPTQPELEYKNCTAAPANTAAVTFLNTTAAKSNVFWMRDAVELVNGSMDQVEFDGMAGVTSMSETTDSGITIMFSKGAAINDLTVKYRWDIFATGVVLEPQLCGVLLGGQA